MDSSDERTARRTKDSQKIHQWLERVDRVLASEGERYLIGTPLYRPGKPEEAAKAQGLPMELTMKDDLHANQVLLASNLQALSSIVSSLVKGIEQAPNTLTSASPNTHPHNHYQPILYNQGTSHYPHAPLHPFNLTRNSEPVKSISGQLGYAVDSQQDSSSFSSFSDRYPFPEPYVGEIGRSRALSLRLGDSSILNYHAEDRTYPPATKLMNLPTREYLQRLQMIWDDTDEHWDENQSSYKIRGTPIAMKYWGPDTIYPWDCAIRTQHSQREDVRHYRPTSPTSTALLSRVADSTLIWYFTNSSSARPIKRTGPDCGGKLKIGAMDLGTLLTEKTTLKHLFRYVDSSNRFYHILEDLSELENED
ncbi:hypothetical protein F5880DRAFT_1616465 [Lentinula raphanica]|nr:hypothetical protein F5880DRAFT_1616465 [Lentinula raphanica]